MSGRGARLRARSEIEFITQTDNDVDFGVAIKRLPYIFHDPIAIDKKMDPRQHQFGSRISLEESAPTKTRK